MILAFDARFSMPAMMEVTRVPILPRSRVSLSEPPDVSWSSHGDPVGSESRSCEQTPARVPKRSWSLPPMPISWVWSSPAATSEG